MNNNTASLKEKNGNRISPLYYNNSLVQKIKLFVYNTSWYQLKQSLTNKSGKNTEKMPICKDQQIAYFLLIYNVSYFEKMSIPFLSNDNNLFPQQ